MQSYVEQSDYLKYYTVVPDNFEQLANKASRIIDTLTYNRIVATGYENLTEFQRETITECCCEIVQFYDDNVDILDSVLNSYSINGVSMQFNTNLNICIKNGCVIRTNTYGRLMSTGLCYGGI